MSKKGFIGSVALAVVLVLGVILGFMCTERIPAGYVGVVYNMNGGVDGEVLTQGWHMVAPTKKVTTYSVGIEQSYLTAGKDGDSPDDDSFETPSSDGKGLKVDLTFTYRYDMNAVANTFVRFKGQSGRELLTTFIKPNVISWTKEVTARYPVTEIIGDQRAALNTVLTEYLEEKFRPYGIIIESASLIDINPDEETREAIQKKVTAQQELELANIEAETARVQAEKDREVARIAAEAEREVAEINAENALIKAKADAEATKVRASAEADANKQVAASLTHELLDKLKYEKWDGELPTVSGSSALVTIDGVE